MQQEIVEKINAFFIGGKFVPNVMIERNEPAIFLMNELSDG